MDDLAARIRTGSRTIRLAYREGKMLDLGEVVPSLEMLIVP